jgi:hypothetical protein
MDPNAPMYFDIDIGVDAKALMFDRVTTDP